MVVFPPCKINLGLHITRKREDGYHELETCFYPIPWTDILEIVPANEFSFSSSGLPIQGSDDHNLCVKAYKLLQQDFALPPVAIHLHKVIPMGAGLGGGSSDGAYTLRVLNTIFTLGLSTEQLASYAAQLGSDCSFFLYDHPMLATGRGEILTHSSVSLKEKYCLLIYPALHITTAQAYAMVKPAPALESLAQILTRPLSWKHELVNDFETSIFPLYPALQDLKVALYNAGATYAAMSGSGSTLFGIFNEAPDTSSFKHLTTFTAKL
jgi:4-diphosphocytidyl-2-C-methyl-D-erythritol kinase